MNKIAIVYWSGTGNTAAMAEKIKKGAEDKGANVQVYKAGEFEAGLMDAFDIIAFGCPAMGAEGLEDTEFEPMFEPCRPKLKGKKTALFGSYGWGDGTWLDIWEENCREDGAYVVVDSLSCCGFPSGSAAAECAAFGTALAEA